MKTKLVALILFLGFTQLPAAYFDLDGFGRALNGFHKHKKLAQYSINRQTFVTTIPTVTRRKGGGLFISTQVYAGKWANTSNVGVIELAVSPQGYLTTAQLRLTVSGSNITTALVERPAKAAPPAAGSPALPDPEPWKTATSTMVTQLFSDLNSRINKLDSKEKGSRDLYSRMTGRGNMLTHFPPALRHNLNLLLGSIH